MDLIFLTGSSATDVNSVSIHLEWSCGFLDHFKIRQKEKNSEAGLMGTLEGGIKLQIISIIAA